MGKKTYHIVDPETGEVVEKLRYKRWDKVHTVGLCCWLLSGPFLLLSYFLRNASDLLLGFALYSCVILCIGGLVLANISSHFIKKDSHKVENESEE